MGNFFDFDEARLLFSGLQLTQITRIHSNSVREFFLRPALLQPEPSQALPELDASLVGHASIIRYSLF